MTQPKRFWDDAIAKRDGEGCCRVCGKTWGVEFAHLSGRKFDPVGPLYVYEQSIGTEITGQSTRIVTYVRPESGIPLCGPATDTTTCHGKQHAGRLDLLPHITNEEAACAVSDLGLYRAYHSLAGEARETALIGQTENDEREAA